MSTITKDLRNWLNGEHVSRDVEIRFHVHGLRVSLYENGREILSRVESTLEEAFQSCLKDFEKIKKIKLQERIQNLQNSIHRNQDENKIYKKEQEQLKKQLKEME